MLNETAAAVNRELDLLMPAQNCPEKRVIDAMRYALLAGGKRIRPFLVMKSAEIFGVNAQHALRVAASIEMLHTYSLIHDDLPAMDNSDLRRGRRTTHKEFDEATAILAGDGLLTKSFEILAHPDTHPKADVRANLVLALAQTSGMHGMVGGQMIDLQSENAQKNNARAVSLTIDEITYLQDLKTGAIISFSAEAGAIMGEASMEDRQALATYAKALGLAFQIVDDLLDAEGDASMTGKPVGADANAGKATFVSLLGLEGARRHAQLKGSEARHSLDRFGERAAPLHGMVDFVLNRRS